MGGKTQQRVAGNAKPTSSGRIRELLINQQVGTSNIITFSALSGKKQSKPPTKEDAIKKDSPTSSLPKPIQSPNETQVVQPKDETPREPPVSKPTTPGKDNTRLVVRRVGNRDYYTRVKISDGISDETLLTAVQPSDAGVKKPPKEMLDQMIKPTDSIKEISDEDEVSQASESAMPEIANEDPDEKLDFDELLARLEASKLLVASNSTAKTLPELSATSIEHEKDLLKVLRISIRKFISEMSLEEWDLVSSSLNKWIGWVSKTDYPLQDICQAEFCASIFMFIHQLIYLAEKFKKEPSEDSSFLMMQALLDDWSNFSSSTMFLDLITLYLKLMAEENKELSERNPTIKPMIEALAHIILSVDTRIVLSHHDLLNYLSTNIEFDQGFKKPKSSTFCAIANNHSSSFSGLCGLLRSNLRVILVTAHTILSKTMPSILEGNKSTMLMQDQETVDDLLVFPPEALMAILTSRDSMMSALLSDYRVGDISVTIEPNTDAYACTLSYLFVWDLIIKFIVGVDKELGQCIIHSLKKLGLIQRFLDNIFILLPPLDDKNSLNFKIESDDKNSQVELDLAHWDIDTFLKLPLKTTVSRPVNEIELVALHSYFSIASHMPVTVRKWYNNNANKRLCNLVNEYTVKHISKVICSLEMESVQAKCQERANKESKNLTIKARPSAKEVYAIYTRDEFKMELTIKLPLNYPLGPVQIDGGKRVGVTDVKWRSWLLQLTTFLSHQNGPILDGIDLWRTNIDKRFEGVEKCTICFSILHSNYQLPKKKCQTCANMFHNLCLYKWFESSGNSTCPLCRNPW